MGQIISDTFSGATQNLTAHSPDTNVPGGIYADFNFVPALKTDGAGNCVSASGTGGSIGGDVLPNTGSSDYKAQIQVTVPNQGVVGTYKMSAGLLVRLLDGVGGGHSWVVGIQNDLNTAAGYYVFLALLQGGVYTVNQVLASGLSLNNSQHTLAVSMSGKVYTVSLDATIYTAYTDASNTYTTATAVGPFIVNGGGYAAATLQNLSVVTVPLVITQTTLPSPKPHVAYSQTITSTGGYQPTVTYAISSGALPPGLTLATTGVLSGTATSSGSFTFTVTATDSLSDTGAQSYTFVSASAPFLVTPDPRQTNRTRKFQQGVAYVLNSLMQSGTIQPVSGGGFTMGALAIGDAVTGGHYTGATGGDLLYVGAGAVLAQDDRVTYDPIGNELHVGNGVGGVVATDSVQCVNIQASNTVECVFMSLQGPFGEIGFFQGLVDSSTGLNSAFVIWQNDDPTPNYPSHVFVQSSFGNYTAAATLGVMTAAGTINGAATGAATYAIVGLSSTGTTPYTFSIDASGNWIGGSGIFKNASANALTAGRQGATNPAFNVDASTALSVTGLNLKAAASGGGFAISVISSAGAENLKIDALGTGTVTFGSVSTGNVAMSRNTTVAGTLTVTSANASALAVGRQGATNPGLKVDASAASCVTGIAIQSLATGAGVTITTISTAATEGMTWASKGNGFMSFTAGTGQLTFGCGGFAVNAGSTGAVSFSCGVVRLGPIPTGTLGTFGATPVLQQSGDVATALVAYGLMSSANYSGDVIGGQSLGYVASDITTTSSGMANVTGLSFAIGAGETWSVEFNLLATGSLGGMLFQLTGPAAPTLVTIFTQGDTTGVGVVSSDQQSAFSTPTQAYVAGAFTGVVTMKALIVNGANAGTIQLQFADNVNLQSNTIKAGSYFTARRVA